MPDNFDDEQIDNMSINDINELFEDVIEIPDEYKFLAVSHSNRYYMTADTKFGPCL